MTLLFWMESISKQQLKESCAELHTKAENTRLTRELMSGSMDPLIYKSYCYQLYLIADAIESKVQLPVDLQRRHLLVQDVAAGPGCAVKACKSTLEYTHHIRSQFLPHMHGQLNGHIYAHYLGWLYGGQMIAKKLSFLPKKHLEFKDPKANIDYVRNVILGMVWDRDALEAQKAFEYTIRIYDEIYWP